MVPAYDLKNEKRFWGSRGQKSKNDRATVVPVVPLMASGS